MSLVTWNFYTDYARWFNMVMLAGCIAVLTANMIIRRNQINRRTRRITAWIYLILLDFVYAYAITIREHRPFNLAVGVGSVLLLGTIFAIIWNPPGDDKHPPHDGSCTSRFMYWLDRKVRAFKARHNLGGYKMTDNPQDPIVDEDEGTPQPNPYEGGTAQQETGEDVPDPEGYSDDATDD